MFVQLVVRTRLMTYQPISTVPRDGTPVVLRDPDGRSICAVFSGNNITLQGTKDAVPRIFEKETGDLAGWLRWTYAERA